jgi:hypothetical protein
MKKKQTSYGTIKLPGYRQSEKNIIDDPSAIICCEADDHCIKQPPAKQVDLLN